MNSSIFTRSLKYLGIAGVGAIVGGFGFLPSAFAQEPSAQPEMSEGITVLAPYVVHKKVVGRSRIGAPIEVLSVSRSVSYADLDLSKAPQAAELKRRISVTAKDACDFLFKRDLAVTLLPASSSRDCVRAATAEAMILADEVIAASNG